MSSTLIIFFAGVESQIDGVLHEDGISSFVVPRDSGGGSLLVVLRVHGGIISWDKKNR